MKVNCTAVTCRFNLDGLCNSDEIRLIDFEYYKDLDGYKKDLSEDDMKCMTYKSIYKDECNEFIKRN